METSRALYSWQLMIGRVPTLVVLSEKPGSGPPLRVDAPGERCLAISCLMLSHVVSLPRAGRMGAILVRAPRSWFR